MNPTSEEREAKNNGNVSVPLSTMKEVKAVSGVTDEQNQHRVETTRIHAGVAETLAAERRERRHKLLSDREIKNYKGTSSLRSETVVDDSTRDVSKLGLWGRAAQVTSTPSFSRVVQKSMSGRKEIQIVKQTPYKRSRLGRRKPVDDLGLSSWKMEEYANNSV